ncbi:1702_t:CDS:1, partial [Gigaspora rosea]
SWIERHCNLCQYSLDIKRCADTSCCRLPCAKEAMDFLYPNNSFLPPVSKAKDGHFINPIHLLEYYDLLKIPNYDSHCLSLDETTYSRLNCSKCNKYFPTLTFLMYHKRLMHPASRGQPKGKSRNQTEQTEQISLTLDNFSLLPSQRYDQILSSDEVYLRGWTSDNE